MGATTGAGPPAPGLSASANPISSGRAAPAPAGLRGESGPEPFELVPPTSWADRHARRIHALDEYLKDLATLQALILVEWQRGSLPSGRFLCLDNIAVQARNPKANRMERA